MRDRGQSEVLGFVLVFATIVIAVALVTATGFGGLEQARQSAQVENAVVAFEVLADNVDDLVEAGAPSRSVEIKLSDAQLELAEPISVRVTVTSVADPNRTSTYHLEPRPIVYDSRSGSTVVYAAGAVLRSDPGGSVMRRAPDFVLTHERTRLAIIETRSASSPSVGGTRRVHVRAVRSVSPLLVAETSPQNVTIELTSPRADAWERTLSASPDLTCSRPGPETVRCWVISERVHVVAIRTDIEFR